MAENTPPPATNRVVDSPKAVWMRIIAASDRLDPTSRRYAEFILRSVWLRTLEAGRISHWRSARSALRSMTRLFRLLLTSRRSAEFCLRQVVDCDVWVLIEAPTPSHSEGPLAVAKCLEVAGLRCAVLAGTKQTADWLVANDASCRVHNMEQLAGLPRGSNAIAESWSAVRAQLAVRRLISTAGVSVSVAGRLQIGFEAATGALLARGLSHLSNSALPRLVVSSSEYFASSVALRGAAQLGRVPFATLQHGAVNILYSPFLADAYWVWTMRAYRALRAMQSGGTISIIGHPSRRTVTANDRKKCRIRLGVGDERTPILVFFSQSHGLEFSADTHSAVVAELATVRRNVPECVIVIKRHPSERRSPIEMMCESDAGVVVAPTDMSASEIAAAADVALALGSTALVEAIEVGCCAVELLCGESVVAEPLAYERVPVASASRTVSQLLSDARPRNILRTRQEEWLESCSDDAASFEDAVLDAVRGLIDEGRQ